MVRYHNGLRIAILIASVIACLAALYPIITFLTFSTMRKKRFMKFIFYISICDFFVGVASLFGFPSSGSGLCWAQGILAIYFSTASWFWTTCLSYCMYSIIQTGHSNISESYFHVLCWGLPLLLSLLPLVNASYGNSASSLQWCLIVNDSRSSPYTSEMWSYLAYFMWLIICILLMFIWYLRVRRQIGGKSDALSLLVRTTYQRVSWYPVAMICCWSLNYVCIEFTNRVGPDLAGVSMLCGVSYGTFTALVFFMKSQEASGRWYDYISSQEWIWGMIKLRPSTSSIPVDFADEQFNKPFIQSDINSGDSNSNNTYGSGVEKDPDTLSPLGAAGVLANATHAKSQQQQHGRESKTSANVRASMSARVLVAGMSSAAESESSQWTGSSIFTLSERHGSSAESSAHSHNSEFNDL